MTAQCSKINFKNRYNIPQIQIQMFFKKKLQIYLDRLYPYQVAKHVLSLKQRTSTPIQKIEKISEETLLTQIEAILENLHQSRPATSFTLQKKPSNIPNAGSGIFLKGHVPNGQIVALYPGLVYAPHHPVFFNSIANAYLLRCFDGFMVDGKPRGLSKQMYESVYYQWNYPGVKQKTSDLSWLKAGKDEIDLRALKNPLAVGQFINNGTTAYPANGKLYFYTLT